MNNKACIISSEGIGDGLLMMIAAYHLQKAGYDVTMIHPHLHELSSWFPKITFHTKYENLASYAKIIVQNNNSSFMQTLKNLRKQQKIANISIFYTDFQEKKHGTLHPLDAIFDVSIPMADNIASATSHLLSTNYSKETTLVIPPGCSKNKHNKRVVMHPLSRKKLHWPQKKFIKLAEKIQRKGFTISFVMSPEERKKWLFVEKYNIEVPLLFSLNDLAKYLYESFYFIGHDSGPGHLASLLDLPSIILAPSCKLMKLWQPGWRRANIALPSSWFLNIKGLRKENYWPYLISTSHVFKIFKNSI